MSLEAQLNENLRIIFFSNLQSFSKTNACRLLPKSWSCCGFTVSFRAAYITISAILRSKIKWGIIYASEIIIYLYDYLSSKRRNRVFNRDVFFAGVEISAHVSILPRMYPSQQKFETQRKVIPIRPKRSHHAGNQRKICNRSKSRFRRFEFDSIGYVVNHYFLGGHIW